MNANPVLGYLAENWPELNAEAPAVIVNPAASPLDVLAWCWGEVENLHQAADAYAAATGGGLDGSTVAAVFLHRLAPLSCVMQDAIQALVTGRSHCERIGQEGGAV